MDTTTTDCTEQDLLRSSRVAAAERNGFDRRKVKPFPPTKTTCVLLNGHPVSHRKPKPPYTAKPRWGTEQGDACDAISFPPCGSGSGRFSASALSISYR